MDIDENHIRVPHRRVFEINPRELCNFLEFEITNRQDGTELNPPMMEAAIKRCREHIDVGISLLVP